MKLSHLVRPIRSRAEGEEARVGGAGSRARDLREHWAPAAAELERFETDVLSGFVLARTSAGLADGTIRGDVGHLEQIRTWFGQPLWEMEPADADVYFGKVLRNSPGPVAGRSCAHGVGGGAGLVGRRAPADSAAAPWRLPAKRMRQGNRFVLYSPRPTVGQD
ncbi:hypothetical protein GCM10027073_23100 [Streptomyces chlorus]